LKFCITGLCPYASTSLLALRQAQGHSSLRSLHLPWQAVPG
jgi:hypothetical protein